MAASSRRLSNPARRAFTVTTTKLTVNRMCAMTMVAKPVATPALTNRVSSEAPMTTSGVAIGRNTSRLVEARPRN
jgi:hypothetical protein